MKLNENQNKLNDTKWKLEATITELEMAKKNIIKLEECFEQKHNEIIPLIHKSTEVICEHINESLPKQPAEIFKSTLQHKPESPAEIFKSALQPLDKLPPIKNFSKKFIFIEFNKLIRHKQKSYPNKIKRVFENIEPGLLHRLNEGECFFKLRLQRNHRQLYISLQQDVTHFRNHEKKVFENKKIVLSYWSSCYHLFVSIRNYDENNTKCFLIDTKNRHNRSLRYGSGNNIEWEKYKDGNGEVIFYLTKK